MKLITWLPDTAETSGWKERHMSAVISSKGFEVPIVLAIRAWIDYARLHEQRYESPIGEDGVLGPAWAQVGDGIRQLLNGDCGRLDCGTLDTILLDNLTEQGFDPDNL